MVNISQYSPSKRQTPFSVPIHMTPLLSCNRPWTTVPGNPCSYPYTRMFCVASSLIVGKPDFILLGWPKTDVLNLRVLDGRLSMLNTVLGKFSQSNFFSAMGFRNGLNPPKSIGREGNVLISIFFVVTGLMSCGLAVTQLIFFGSVNLKGTLTG